MSRWQRHDGDEPVREDQHSQERRELARRAKHESLWGPFFRNVVDVPELTRTTLMCQKDTIIDYVPYVGPLTEKTAPFRDNLRKAVFEQGTGPTGPYFDALARVPEIRTGDDLADWEGQLESYADQVEREARSVGIVQTDGWDKLPRDFDWLVHQTVYRESPGQIAEAEPDSKISESAVQRAIGRARKLIGLKSRMGRPPNSRT